MDDKFDAMEWKPVAGSLLELDPLHNWAPQEYGCGVVDFDESLYG